MSLSEHGSSTSAVEVTDISTHADVDVTEKIIENPEKFPLKAKSK